MNTLPPFPENSESLAPPRALSEQICQEIRRDICPKACRSALRRLTLSVILLFIISLLILGLSRYVLEREPTSPTSWAMGMLSVMTLLFTWWASRPSSRVPGNFRKYGSILLLGGFITYLIFHSHASCGMSEFVEDPAEVSWALQCGAVAFLIGAIATICIMYLWKASDPISPASTGAMLALSAGMATGFAIDTGCGTYNIWHTGIAHGLTTLLIVAFGAIVGRKILSP